MKMLGMKPKNPGGATPSVTRDDARDAAAADDELRKRRGGAADILTGVGGAEAGTTGRSILG